MMDFAALTKLCKSHGYTIHKPYCCRDTKCEQELEYFSVEPNVVHLRCRAHFSEKDELSYLKPIGPLHRLELFLRLGELL